MRRCRRRLRWQKPLATIGSNRRPKVFMKSPRPVCLSCVSFDVEAVVDGEPADFEFFACFDCRDVYYFMADARPRVRQLGFSELYVQTLDRKKTGPNAGIEDKR